MIKSHQHVGNELSPISTLLLAAAASEAAASTGTISPKCSTLHTSPRSSVIQKSPLGVSPSSSGQQSVTRSQETKTSTHVDLSGSIISRHPYLASQLNSGPSTLFHTFKHGSQSWRDPHSTTTGHGASDRHSGGHEILTSREVEERRGEEKNLNRLKQLTILVPKDSTLLSPASTSEPLLTTCTSPFNGQGISSGQGIGSGQGFGSKGNPYLRRSLSTSSSPLTIRRSLSTSSSPLTSQVEVQIIDDEGRVGVKSASPSGSSFCCSPSCCSPSCRSSSCCSGGHRTVEQDTNQVEETIANPIDVLVDTLGSKARQKSVRGFRCSICQEHMDDPVSFTILLRPDPSDSTYPFFPSFKRSIRDSTDSIYPLFSSFNKSTSPDHVNRNRSPDCDQVCDSVCIFCHHSLLHQWINYELSSHPSFITPYSRNYDVNEYICFVCGSACTRSQVRTLVVTDFPFLLQHPRPAG